MRVAAGGGLRDDRASVGFLGIVDGFGAIGYKEPNTSLEKRWEVA
jgi:hypothetical protein